MFASYDAFRVGVQKLVEGDDLSSTFSTGTLDMLIKLGEARVANGVPERDLAGLRASTMVVKFEDVDTPLEVADNLVALPADWLELKEVYFDGEPPCEVVGLDKLRTLQAAGASSASPRYVAQDGDNLTFWPTASDGPVLGSYYARPAPLKTITWNAATTFARYPEVYLFAALCEGASFVGRDKKLAVWEPKYASLLQAAQHNERMRVWAGSPLRIRTR